ncbi:MAG: helix-turn-helix domain-containing protein [Planctomycetales bacterium]|nr:helix-turn-helix domain-containing protein [Planctomycetales bacterium]
MAGRRFHQVNDFVDIAMANLNRGEIAVYMVLWRDERDGCVRVSQESIASRAGMQKRNCQKAIKSLSTKGFIKVVRQGGLNRGPSIYQIQKTSDWRLNSGG